jgi:hypothetical protein
MLKGILIGAMAGLRGAHVPTDPAHPPHESWWTLVVIAVPFVVYAVYRRWRTGSWYR